MILYYTDKTYMTMEIDEDIEKTKDEHEKEEEDQREKLEEEE